MTFINKTLAMRNAGADLGLSMEAAHDLDTGQLGGRFDGSTGPEVTLAPTDAEVEAAR